MKKNSIIVTLMMASLFTAPAFADINGLYTTPNNSASVQTTMPSNTRPMVNGLPAPGANLSTTAPANKSSSQSNATSTNPASGYQPTIQMPSSNTTVKTPTLNIPPM